MIHILLDRHSVSARGNIKISKEERRSVKAYQFGTVVSEILLEIESKHFDAIEEGGIYPDEDCNDHVITTLESIKSKHFKSFAFSTHDE